MKKSGKHGGRLIIRNLPFSIEESYLRSLLEKIGKLKELSIPLEESKKRNKGFAFVEFEKKNISEKAIKKLNGSKIQKREISIDYAKDKNKYLSALKSEEISKDFKNHSIEEEKIDENIEESIEENDEENIEEKPKTRKTFEFDEGKVLFIMNLNYETQEEDLFELFNSFGKLKYVKIVVKQDTGESKGTGFVCYRVSEDAQKVLKIAEEQGIELHERTLKVVLAVSKDSALNLKSLKRATSDKRNLHLAKLGLIMPGTEQFKALTPKEIEMRTMAAKKIKDKLLNPNIFVSPTRLLFKNIPKVLDEKDLKALITKILTKQDPNIEKQKIFNQVKVMRETERFDKNGNPQSKGFAFVDFKNNELAVLALKECNGNFKDFGEKHKPIVEFALEDHRIVRIRKIKLNRQKKIAEDLKQKEGEGKEKKMGRGKRQRLKKKMMKELNSVE